MNRSIKTAAILLLCITACEPEEDGMSAEECILAGRGERINDAESSLRLVACRVPQLRSDDGSRPAVLILLINDAPSAVWADGTLELGANLFVELSNREGEVLPPQKEGIPFEPMPVELEILPRHGIVGRFIDLACELPGNIVLEENATCVPYLEVERPGEYEATFIARVEWCRQHCRLDEREILDLRSNPVPLVLR